MAPALTTAKLGGLAELARLKEELAGRSQSTRRADQRKGRA